MSAASASASTFSTIDWFLREDGPLSQPASPRSPPLSPSPSLTPEPVEEVAAKVETAAAPLLQSNESIPCACADCQPTAGSDYQQQQQPLVVNVSLMSQAATAASGIAVLSVMPSVEQRLTIYSYDEYLALKGIWNTTMSVWRAVLEDFQRQYPTVTPIMHDETQLKVWSKYQGFILSGERVRRHFVSQKLGYDLDQSIHPSCLTKDEQAASRAHLKLGAAMYVATRF